MNAENLREIIIAGGGFEMTKDLLRQLDSERVKLHSFDEFLSIVTKRSKAVKPLPAPAPKQVSSDAIDHRRLQEAQEIDILYNFLINRSKVFSSSNVEFSAPDLHNLIVSVGGLEVNFLKNFLVSN